MGDGIITLRLVIDRTIRAFGELVADLATHAGYRAPLALLTEQTEKALLDRLEASGVPVPVIAAMLGITPRGLSNKKRGLRMLPDLDNTLWEKLFDRVQQSGDISEARLFGEHPRQDPKDLRSIMRHMIQAKLVRATGKVGEREFSARADGALDPIAAASAAEVLQAFCWAVIFEHGPMTARDVEARVDPGGRLRKRTARVQEALDTLLASGRITARTARTTTLYESDTFVAERDRGPLTGSAILQHIEAMTRTVRARLDSLTRTDAPTSEDRIGGASTWFIDLWPGHPLEDEVLSFYSDTKTRLSELRREGERHRCPEEIEPYRLVVYMGQTPTRNDNGPP